jgi:hypothetical protein
MRRGATAALLSLATTLSVASPAHARAEARSRYTKEQTYHGALRYLRVDLDCEVTERDENAAYLIFRYQLPGRKTFTNGTIEIVETPKAVRVFVQLPKLPQYHEQVLKDGLMKKLGDDYGEPPQRKRDDAQTKRAKKKKQGEGDSADGDEPADDRAED